MPEKVGRGKKWRDLIPLAQRSIDKGDFKTARRVLEGNKDDVVRVVYKGYKYEDGLGFCYEKLGDFEKAAKRYEKFDAPCAAGRAYEQAGDLDKAEQFYKQATGDYRGRRGYIPSIIREAEEGLQRIEKEREKRGGRKPSVKSLGGLEGKLPAVIAISGLVLSLFFLSGITGNVTGLNNSTQSFLGVVLFVIGVISAVWYFKRK